MGKFEVTLTGFQDDFVFSESKYTAMVSAWGTGKSLGLCSIAEDQSNRYKDNLGVIFRKEWTDLRDSTLKDFELYTGLVVSSAREVRIGSSLVMFRHIEELNSIQNMNLGWWAIEQAEELETDDVFWKLSGRLRRVGSSLQGFLVANTKGHNWIWKLFKQDGIYLNGVRQDKLIEAQTKDNAHNLPEEYVKSLEIIKVQKPAVYNRFVLNSWEDEDVVDNLIQARSLENCKKVDILHKFYPAVVVCDPARFGNDESVVYTFRGLGVTKKQYFYGKSTTELGAEICKEARESSAVAIVVDGIGIGAGVVDKCRELTDIDVFDFQSASTKFNSEGDTLKYINLRAKAWDVVAMLIASNQVNIPKDDDELVKQLGGVKYFIKKGKIQIEAKEEIKNRMGRSCDRADAFIMGAYFVSTHPDLKREAKNEEDDANRRTQNAYADAQAKQLSGMR
jgi:hypothetical protein